VISCYLRFNILKREKLLRKSNLNSDFWKLINNLALGVSSLYYTTF